MMPWFMSLWIMTLVGIHGKLSFFITTEQESIDFGGLSCKVGRELSEEL
jgi:hypothetical protein